MALFPLKAEAPTRSWRRKKTFRTPCCAGAALGDFDNYFRKLVTHVTARCGIAWPSVFCDRCRKVGLVPSRTYLAWATGDGVMRGMLPSLTLLAWIAAPALAHAQEAAQTDATPAQNTAAVSDPWEGF